MASRVLEALTQAAVDITGAAAGWLIVVDDDQAEVAVARGEKAEAAVGRRVMFGSGSAGFVLASGQPLAIAPRSDDPMALGGVAVAIGRRPGSILCVPCAGDDGVLGAIEVVDKTGGGPFSFDDVEIVTLLAGVAAAALAERNDGRPPVPEPARLGAELARLAEADATRYDRIAVAVAALLAGE